MALIEYLEFSTAPLPLGKEQAVAPNENRQQPASLGTPPKLSFNAKATDK